MTFLSSRVATLKPILQGAEQGVRRFPLTIVAGTLAACAAMLLVEDLGDEALLERLLVAALLGIPLFTGLRLLSEGRGWRGMVAWIPEAVGVAVLAAFFLAWPSWSEPMRFAHALQLAAAFHLFVAVAPFVRGREDLGFWTFNAALLERLLLAAIYAHVLFVGLAIALLALDNLFGVDVAPTAYPRLWYLAALLFAPWFFVARLPREFAAPARDVDYPAVLRAFARFALLPIVAMYLVILTAYFVKVLVTWGWPSGWIGWLVSAAAIVGIFSLLLVHPLAQRTSDRWVGTFARGFYLLLLPAIVMLWLAIWQRVAQYGLTERRYFLLVLSLWLAGIAVYQLVTRARGIRIIPASLCLVGLVTVGGPWGAYAVSERSQVRRLTGILERAGMLVDGRARAAADEVAVEDRREITAILEYLGEIHGYETIAGWFPDSMVVPGGVLANLGPREGAIVDVGRLMAAFGLEPAARVPEATGPFRFSVRLGDEVPVAGYDVLVRVPRWVEGAPPDSGWGARGDATALTLRVFRDGVLVATFPLQPLIEELRTTGSPRGGVEAVGLEVESAGPWEGRLYLRVVGGRVANDHMVVTDVSGEALLVEPKPEPPPVP